MKATLLKGAKYRISTPAGRAVSMRPALRTGRKGDPGTPGVPGAAVGLYGAWDVGTDYPIDALVEHNGSAWRSVTNPAIGDEPGVAAAWELLVAKGDTGAPGGSDAAFEGWINDTTPSLTRAALSATIALSAPVTVNVRKYGVLVANTAAQNDAGMTALFAAHTAGVLLAFPEEGTYQFDTTWPIRNDLGIRGTGWTTRLKWLTVPALNLTTWIERFSLENALMENAAGGDHLIKMSGGGGFVYGKFRDCALFTNDAGKSILYMLSVGTPNFFGTKFANVHMERLATATVPAIDLVCASAAGMNTVDFDGGLWHSHLANTTPFFRAEVTAASTYFTKWSFKRVIGEQNLGGMIHMYSASIPTLEQVVDHDAAGNTYTDHLFKFSKTTGSFSRAIKFDQSGSAGVAVFASGKGHLSIDAGYSGHDVGKIVNAGVYGVAVIPNNAGTIRKHGGGFANAVTTTATNLTLDPSHGTILVNSAIPRTITLPDPTALLFSGDMPIGREFTIYNIGAAAASVVSAGTATLDGDTSASLVQREGALFKSDGTNWFRVNHAPAERRLATVTGINAKTVAATTLYTVPSGKTAVITRAVIRCTAATAITVAPTVGIGVAAGEDDNFASTALTGLTTDTAEWHFTRSGLAVKNAAAAVVKLGVDTGATGTSQTIAVDLIGYLI